MLLPTVAAALAFAPLAHAAGQTVAPQTCTATTAATLDSCVSEANSASPGTLTIITIGGNHITADAPITLTGNTEITGLPTLQASTTTTGPVINGQTVYTKFTSPLFTIGPNANVLFKGFGIQNGGNGSGTGAIEVDGTGEFDNLDIDGSEGTAMVVNGTATITNTDIEGGVADGVENNGTTTMVNDTLWNNQTGGISGTGITLVNTLLAKNAQTSGSNCMGGAPDSAQGSYSSDNSCAGATFNSAVGNMNNTTFNGGPTESTSPKAGNPAINGVSASSGYCPTADQRFFLSSSSTTCNAGSYQTGSQDTSTSGPSCTVASKTENTSGTGPAAQEVVNVQEPSGIGIGPDTVNNTTTDNGTVGYPTVGTTWFNETTPSNPFDTDLVTNGTYPVTATKPATDSAVNDTHWSFYASDWLGNTTHCS